MIVLRPIFALTAAIIALTLAAFSPPAIAAPTFPALNGQRQRDDRRDEREDRMEGGHAGQGAVLAAGDGAGGVEPGGAPGGGPLRLKLTAGAPCAASVAPKSCIGFADE